MAPIAFMASMTKPASAGLAVGAAVAFVSEVAAGEPPANWSLLWGAVLGALASIGVSMLWQTLDRVKNIVWFLWDRLFDVIERRVGMTPTDFEPLDPIAGPKPQPKDTTDDEPDAAG